MIDALKAAHSFGYSGVLARIAFRFSAEGALIAFCAEGAKLKGFLTS